jgi:hypothetical protein
MHKSEPKRSILLSMNCSRQSSSIRKRTATSNPAYSIASAIPKSAEWEKAQEVLHQCTGGLTSHTPSQNPDSAFSNKARSCCPIPCMICALSKAPLDAASCCSVCSCLAVRGVRCADRAVHGALGASDFPPINAPFPLTVDVCGRPVSAREVLQRWGSKNSAHAIQTTAQYLSTQILEVHLLNTASVVRILCRGSCGTHIAPPPLPLSAAAVV